MLDPGLEWRSIFRTFLPSQWGPYDLCCPCNVHNIWRGSVLEIFDRENPVCTEESDRTTMSIVQGQEPCFVHLYVTQILGEATPQPSRWKWLGVLNSIARGIPKISKFPQIYERWSFLLTHIRLGSPAMTFWFSTILIQVWLQSLYLSVQGNKNAQSSGITNFIGGTDCWGESRRWMVCAVQFTMKTLTVNTFLPEHDPWAARLKVEVQREFQGQARATQSLKEQHRLLKPRLRSNTPFPPPSVGQSSCKVSPLFKRWNSGYQHLMEGAGCHA